MADGMLLLTGLAALALLLVLLGGAAQMYADAGIRVFCWPRLDHGYEIQHATRLASVFWYLLIFMSLLNVFYLLLFSDSTDSGILSYGLWITLLLLAVGIVHLLDYRRSRLAALLTLLAVLATAIGLWHLSGSWLPVVLMTPLVLWSINGVRATFADRAFA
jgi:hypothetical protein